MSGYPKIEKSVAKCHDKKWGYVVYRCTYSSDEEWAQFMQRLDQYVAAAMAGHAPYGDVSLIVATFTWTVIEDKAQLETATKSDVRRLFQQWAESVNGWHSVTKYSVCIYADQEVVEAVLTGEDPGEHYTKRTAYVKLIHRDFEEQPDQFCAAEVPDDTTRARLNAGDEGYPSVEGYKREDVGWMKVKAAEIVPGAYSVLMPWGWERLYQRPPAVASVQ